MQPARSAAGRMNADTVLAIANFCIFPIQQCNESFARQSLATAARGDNLRYSNELNELSRFNESTIHVATARHVLEMCAFALSERRIKRERGKVGESI
jgi:hypothetical protein